MQQETIDPSTAGKASSAQSRINIPLNLANWKNLDQDIQDQLLWFHQYALDHGLTLKECGEALNYDESTIYRVLKGIYEGNWSNIIASVQSYRRLVEERGTIQKQEFVENRISKLVWAALDYALANNSITLIAGDSRRGKTAATLAWKQENNHGRAVYVIAPAYGGTKALLSDIAKAVGVNRNLSAVQMHDSILRAFNGNRILIVDEAHRLLPQDRRTNPVSLEVLRDIHDRSKAALALIATQRFEASLKASSYIYEQLLGRIGMPVKLPDEVKDDDFMGILRQFIGRPTKALIELCHKQVNERGSFGLLVETLKVASRIASKKREVLCEEHVRRAIALRQSMSQGQMA